MTENPDESDASTVDPTGEGTEETATEPVESPTGETTGEGPGETTEETTGETTEKDTEASDVGRGEQPPLSPRDIERVLSVLEAAVEDGALEGQRLQRVVALVERAVTGPSAANPETVMELVAVLEEFVLDRDDLEEVDGMLGVLEEAIAGGTPADEENLADVFGVLEEGLRDPSGLDPRDVERFRGGLEGLVVDATDPARGGLDWLFPVAAAGEVPEGDAAGDEALEAFRIARLAAGMTQRATGSSLESGVRIGTRMAYAAANSSSAADLLTRVRAIALDELQRAGVDLGDERIEWLAAHEDELVDERPLTVEALRERGERLLVRSAEVGRDETVHPAYPTILDELAADEARILRFLATEGRQPTMDVREREYVPFRSRPLVECVTMLGTDAGCRHPERTPAYLEHLEGLGLVTFSAEPVEDLKRYQVLEAKPHLDAARQAASRPKLVYGSVHLSAFGVVFCETCMPFEVAFEHPSLRYHRRLREESSRGSHR